MYSHRTAQSITTFQYSFGCISRSIFAISQCVYRKAHFGDVDSSAYQSELNRMVKERPTALTRIPNDVAAQAMDLAKQGYAHEVFLTFNKGGIVGGMLPAITLKECDLHLSCGDTRAFNNAAATDCSRVCSECTLTTLLCRNPSARNGRRILTTSWILKNPRTQSGATAAAVYRFISIRRPF